MVLVAFFERIFGNFMSALPQVIARIILALSIQKELALTVCCCSDKSQRCDLFCLVSAVADQLAEAIEALICDRLCAQPDLCLVSVAHPARQSLHPRWLMIQFHHRQT